MARIKYSELFYPIQGEHYGFSFIANHYGHSMTTAPRNSTKRTTRQWERMHALQKAIANWRNMSPEVQAAWETFAATFPQRSERSATVYLTGFQLFVKRNQYCFLNSGIDSDFLLLPDSSVLSSGSIVFSLQPGLNSVDVTELYIKNFGMLPVPGQFVQFAAVAYSETSGQFFEPVFQSLEVLEIAMDGFFIQIDTTGTDAGIVFAVYLSKPLNKGFYVKSSKYRYMGCFTTKSFLGLADVPAVTPADAGKVWGVNPAGEWELIESGGGGGLSCEDLPACPTIIEIFEALENLQNQITDISYVSSPPVKFGLLYKYFVCIDARNIAPVGWEVPNYADWLAMQTYLGGASVSGGPLKDTDSLYWLSPNTGATNAKKTNFKGGGWRNLTDGSFSYKANRFIFWLIDYFSATSSRIVTTFYSNASTSVSSSDNDRGCSIVLLKRSSGVADGETTTMRGNDGRLYRAVSINNNYWLADPLAETRFRTGELIPEVTDNATWVADSSSMLCAYDNDWINV